MKSVNRGLLIAALLMGLVLGLSVEEAVSLPVSSSGTFSLNLSETATVYDDAEVHLAVLIQVTAGEVEIQYHNGSAWTTLATAASDQGCVFEGEWSQVRVRGVAQNQSTGSYEVRNFADGGSALGTVSVEMGTSPTRVYYSTMTASRRWIVIEADDNNTGDVDVLLTSTGGAIQSAEPGDGMGVERSTTEYWLSGTSGDSADASPKAPTKQDEWAGVEWVDVKQHGNEDSDKVDEPGVDNTTCYIYQVKNNNQVDKITVKYKKRVDGKQVDYEVEVDPSDTTQFQCEISEVVIEYEDSSGGTAQWRRRKRP